MRTQLVSTILRASARHSTSTLARGAAASQLSAIRQQQQQLQQRRLAHAHAEESFEAFTARYVAFFNEAEDLFELQRGLNNCFAHDLVPAPAVVEAAIRAARRVNDYATAVRIFEGVKEKVENKAQYKAYLDELKGLKEELGITTKEELYPSLS